NGLRAYSTGGGLVTQITISGANSGYLMASIVKGLTGALALLANNGVDSINVGTGSITLAINSVGVFDVTSSLIQCWNDVRLLRTSQAGQPTPSSTGLRLWHDSTNGKVYLILNDPTLGVK